MKTLVLTVCSLLLWDVPGFGEVKDRERDGHAVGFPTSASHWVVPAMANTPGKQGAFFKTRVVIYNHTSSSYPIRAALFGSAGLEEGIDIPLEPNASVTWDNFLGEVFDYSGAGAVVFNSCGPDADDETCGNLRYSVTAQVYSDSPNGRFKTMVVNGVVPYPSIKLLSISELGLPDFLSGTLNSILASIQEDPPLNHGINVNEMERTNVGVFNFTDTPRPIQAEVMDASGNLVEVVDFGMVPPWSWRQLAIVGPVNNGVVQWKVQEDAPIYLWAVVVDNQSNDGSFFPAIRALVP